MVWSADSCSAYMRPCLKSAEVNWNICGEILRINFLSLLFNIILLHNPVYVHWRVLTLVNEFKYTIFEMHETSWEEIKPSLIVENLLISFITKSQLFWHGTKWYFSAVNDASNREEKELRQSLPLNHCSFTIPATIVHFIISLTKNETFVKERVPSWLPGSAFSIYKMKRRNILKINFFIGTKHPVWKHYASTSCNFSLKTCILPLH